MFVQWLFVFHVLGFIMWLGSLMIVTRVMAFHTSQDPAVGEKLGVLENKIFMGGALPGMILAIVAGLWMAFELDWNPLRPSISGPSFHIKLTLVALLLVVHFMVQAGIQKLRRGETSGGGRYKAYHGIVSLLLLGILIAAAVLYPYFRQKKLDEVRAEPAVEASVTP